MRGKRVVNDPKARDKPCLRCGYSLRKLEEARQCPECGLSVWLSLNNNDSLEFSNPRWLHLLSLACFALAFAQAVALLNWLGFMVMRAYAPAEELAIFSSLKWPMAAQDAYVVFQAIPLFLLAGHERRYPDKLKTFRWTLLVIGAICVAIGILLLVSNLRHSPASVPVRSLPFVQRRVSVFVFLGAIPAVLFLMRLARRGPRPRVAKFCAGIAISAAMWLLLWIRAGWIEATRLDMLTPLFLLVTLGTYLWFGRMFLNSAREADRAWAVESAGVQ